MLPIQKLASLIWFRSFWNNLICSQNGIKVIVEKLQNSLWWRFKTYFNLDKRKQLDKNLELTPAAPDLLGGLEETDMVVVLDSMQKYHQGE